MLLLLVLTSSIDCSQLFFWLDFKLIFHKIQFFSSYAEVWIQIDQDRPCGHDILLAIYTC